MKRDRAGNGKHLCIDSKLKSIATADTLIVTSIQKMSNIRDEEGGKTPAILS